MEMSRITVPCNNLEGEGGGTEVEVCDEVRAPSYTVSTDVHSLA